MLRARIAVLLATLLALAPVVAHAHARYFCRMMDRVVDDCCCAAEAELSARTVEARVQVPDCCEKLSRGTLPSADARRDPVVPTSLDLVLPPEVAGVLPPLSRDARVSAREEVRIVPARGPPLYIKNCALLI